MRRIIPVFLIAGVAASGCATKKYVGKEVGEINTKVENLNGEVEKTQERVKRNEVRIDVVNQTAQTAQLPLTCPGWMAIARNCSKLS